MLLSSLRNAVLVFTSLYLVNLTFALPVLRDVSVDFVGRTRGSDASAVLDRETIPDLREFLYNVQPDVHSRSTNVLQPREEAQLDARRNHHIGVTDAAKQDIHDMLPENHTRKQYKDAKRWHRALVQNEMKSHRASSASITRGAHAGGSNPSEKEHITVTLYRQKGRPGRKGERVVIPSTYKNHEGHVVDGKKHHVYVVQVSSYDPRSAIDYCFAPETLLKNPTCGLETDVWMLGYLVFQLLTGKKLLTSMGTAAERLGEIRDIFESSIPDAWLGDEVVQALPIANTSTPSLEQKLKQSKSLTEDEASEAYVFLRRCLVIDPTSRASSSDLEEDDWVEEGAQCAFCYPGFQLGE
ncbi:hypothetical protein DFP72DRAFT_1109554 [Ephemerocybe angulata]|uniref:Protein kinase domain-containing protein n=1 Tax=Ephemerocybe angulata TaxID=980116 RepID=A0A8H6MBJ9_9AGAR|nr:hypothetical protein DFP72DRAFT_1109554 [Tulosesus angulatus]